MPSGIFATDVRLIFFPPILFSFYSESNFGTEQCLDSGLPDLFLCFLLLLFAVFMKLHTVLSR